MIIFSHATVDGSFPTGTERRKTTMRSRATVAYRAGGRFKHATAMASKLKHGHAAGGRHTSEYSTWAEMIQRCTNPRNRFYAYYGGRGITVCKRWRASFKKFLSDMGRRPTPLHSIDRRNGNRGYKPSNCRWATKAEQMNNIASNRKLTLNGVTRNMSQWADRLGFGRNTIPSRLRRGWSVKRSLTMPVIKN